MLRQLNLKDLQNHVDSAIALELSVEEGWRMFVEYYAKRDTTIPETGIKQVYTNVFKTRKKTKCA